MKNFFLITVLCMLCFSCGVKSDPEYKSQENNNKFIHIV